ncbi:hypothetical protein GCM10011578_028130 [Streptomyces fuscichromogenes]|uniref:Uncharacterized protein n=1 Tax=Streptomyces fuscichromogenes TaxID=1324013 RepID=A0A917XBE2_9ACTN|nr:hypothetical protein GCM10011578_028130 [Streptomyces fuscichromogenes]
MGDMVFGGCFDGRPVRMMWRTGAAAGSVVIRCDPPDAPAPELFRRVPGDGRRPRWDGPLVSCDTHLWVAADATRRTELREHADVLVARMPVPLSAAGRRVRALLAAYPGCLVAAVPDVGRGCVAGVRDRTGAVGCLRATVRGPAAALVHPQPVASVLHAWVASGASCRSLRSLALVLRR